MRKVKRAIAVLLMLSVMIGLMAGCVSQEESSSSAQQSASTQESEQSKTQSSEPASEEQEEPTKFKVAFLRTGRDNSWMQEDNTYLTALEEKHNVDIEWYSYDDWSEKKALVLMGGEDMPDAFFGRDFLTTAELEANKSVFVELTDLISENMPNYSAILEKDSMMKYFATNMDGEIYGLSYLAPQGINSVQLPFINQKWLDNLGLDLPTNIEELEAVLKAFKEQDANGNGDPNDEIPLVAKMKMDTDLRTILLPFNTGVGSSGYWMHLDENSELEFMPATENFKEAVKWVHSLYEQGLVDQEAFTMSSEMLASKYTGDKCGVVYMFDQYEQMGEVAEQFVPLPIADMEGNVYIDSYDDAFMGGAGFMVTKDCENPERLLQWVDDFYDIYNTLCAFYGNDYVEAKDDGSFHITDSTEKGVWNVAFRNSTPMYGEFDESVKITYADTVPDYLAIQNRKDFDIHYSNEANCAMNWMKYTTEETERLSLLRNDMKDFVRNTYAEWVVNGNVDAQWDAYIAELEAYNYKEFVQIHNDAYERFKSETGR